MERNSSALHREQFHANFKRGRSQSVNTDKGSPLSALLPSSPHFAAHTTVTDGASAAAATAEEDVAAPSPHPPLFELVPLSSACAVPVAKLRFGVEGLRIGRDASRSDLVLGATAVSRLHCVLSVLGAEVFVHDNSFNGTFINGRRVGRGRCSVLRPLDTLAFMNPTCAEAEQFSFEFSPLAGHAVPRLHAIAGMERYEMGPVVGQGSFAAVRLATDRQTGAAVAIKLIERRRLSSEEAAASLHTEIEMMRSMDHPHVVRVLDAFEGTDCVALVMEYVRGGDLFDYVVGRGRNPFSEAAARHLFVQLLEAVRYIHARSIIHCDLKPENVLVDPVDCEQPGTEALPGVRTTDTSMTSTAGHSGIAGPAGTMLSALDNHQSEAKALSPFKVRLKLTDFGVAKYAGGTGEERVGEGEGDEEGGGGGGCTPVYAAPELTYYPPLDGSSGAAPPSVRVTSAVDVWSLGVLLYILCSGTVPKAPPPGAPVAFHSCMGELSPACTDLIARMMVTDPTQRITLREICRHPWLEGVSMADSGGGREDAEGDEDALSVTTLVSPRFVRAAKPAANARAKKASLRIKKSAEED